MLDPLPLVISWCPLFPFTVSHHPGCGRRPFRGFCIASTVSLIARTLNHPDSAVVIPAQHLPELVVVDVAHLVVDLFFGNVVRPIQFVALEATECDAAGVRCHCALV